MSDVETPKTVTFRERLEPLIEFAKKVIGSGTVAIKVLVISMLALALVEAVLVNYALTSVRHGQQFPITEISRLADKERLITATVHTEDGYVSGTACTLPLKDGLCDGGTVSEYNANYDRNSGSTNLIDNLSKTVAVRVDQQQGKVIAKFVMLSIVPLMGLANLFGIIFVSRGTGSGAISDIVGFGGIGRKRKKLLLNSTGVSFDDVAGAEEAVAELREVRDYLRDPEKYKALGALPPKGVLLLGPPGCGKTLLARAVAGESNVPFFSMSGAEFVESLVGVGAARVRDLFRQAHEFAPAIIFIDELDAAARKRNMGGGSGGTDEREQTLNQMLVAMDGFEVSSGVVVMGATNRPDILDPALLRPGRFDRHVTVDEPDVHGREAILALHARKKPLAADVDINYLAHRTPGFTGADLANVVNEAALLAIRDGRPNVEMTKFLEAIQRVIGGPQRRGHLMTDEERERVSYHESGHAIVAGALGRADTVHRVSIVARGRGLGTTQLSTDSDKVLHTRTELLDTMVVTMAGRAAEELRFNEPSTTAENDIERITDLARQMIGRYGMSTVLGPIRLLQKDLDLFLGGETASVANVSPLTLQEFDAEVRKVVEFAGKRALELCQKHSADLDKMAAALAEEETLEGPNLEDLMAVFHKTRAPRRASASTGNGHVGPGASGAGTAQAESASAASSSASSAPGSRTKVSPKTPRPRRKAGGGE
ncbi:MAG: ATP-dependent zinc metalloprotease FtsH [Candidatus Dormibacteria bacterium]